MDNELQEFLSSPEIVMAGIGLGIVLVLAVFLSIYQQIRAKRDSSELAGKVKSATHERIPFWIGIGTGSGRARNPQFFRVYSGSQDLLFLHIGPSFVFIDPDTVRGTNPQHWLRSFWGKGAVLVLSGVAVLAVLLRNKLALGLTGSGHFLAVILAVSALLAVILLFALPRLTGAIARRCEELDAKSLDELRSAANQEPDSFVATPETVANFHVLSPAPRTAAAPIPDASRTITFEHKVSGKWSIQTITTQDTQAAMQALRALWNTDQIHVETPAPTAAAPQEEVASGGTFSMNGCGTMCVEVRGEVDWGDRLEDCDSVLGVCLFGVLLIPYRAVHTTDWHSHDGDLGGHRYRSLPIRWTWGLLATAYFRRWWVVCMVAGVILGAMVLVGSDGIGFLFKGLQEFKDRYVWLDTYRIPLAVLSVLMIIVPIGIRWWIETLNRRHRDIRLILGRHLLGSSDPLYWSQACLRAVQSSTALFGTATYGEAVEPALALGDFTQAMFAARLTAAQSDHLAGEKLTDTILNTPKVEAALKQIRPNPSRRTEFIPPAKWRPELVFG